MAIRDPKLNYRHEDGIYLIELFLRSPRQIFNSLDPAPFHEKDLDNDAEAYIVEAVEELHVNTPMQLCIYLPPEELNTEQAQDLPEAIHHYFGYRVTTSGRALRTKLQQGRFSLFVGLAFLVACLTARSALQHYLMGTLHDVIDEGLLIIGWVSMWRPVQIFLYDWWPIRYRQRVHETLSRIDVRVLPQFAHAVQTSPASA